MEGIAHRRIEPPPIGFSNGAIKIPDGAIDFIAFY
jgi:hypothetical protein